MGGYSIFAVAAGIVVLIVIGKILSFPLKILKKLVINGIIGGALLYVLNFLGGFFNISLAINPLTALIAGFLGIPGIALMLILQIFI